MKKLLNILVLGALLCIAGCHTEKSSPYNRNSAQDDYEHFLGKHIFAACTNSEYPYASYSLANLRKTPSDNDPRYKVTFVNGPCKGQTIWTTRVILKTQPVGTENIPRGTVLLRNYWNPKEPYNQEKTDLWNLGVVSNNSRLEKGIVDLEFPRDANDFNPARESLYLHNVRYIEKPQVKDVRTFIW
ncbi:MAG: hypothetical protein IKP96_03745 [Elusimicrobiaceae bacterium]|nr:hypothetical protein [Elusimicrobiaceae bacterium]